MVVPFLDPVTLTALLWGAVKGLGKSVASEKLKKLLEEPESQKAWKTACVKVAAEFPAVLDKYTPAAVATSPYSSGVVTVDEAVQAMLDQADLSTVDSLYALLVDPRRVRTKEPG